MSIKVDENDPVGELEPSFSYRDVTIRRNVDMKEFYDLEGEIGRGKFGTVYRCREKSSGLTLAAKFVGIGRREDRRNVEREVQIMRMLQHPRIIQLYDACEAANVMCVIQELIEGGELFDRVIGEDFILTEKSCTVFVRQICEGVAFIHSKNVLHLDLKPENILCLTRTGNRIKIIDFGLARQYDPSKKLQVLFGTPEFVAPEVVNFDAISFGTDMWSVGVICYVLLSGLSPFMGETDVETMANVTIAQYDFDDEAFDDISEDAKDFIRKLLAKDISCRYTAAECLNHPWLLRRPLPVPDLETAKDNLRDTVERWGEREPTPPSRVTVVSPPPTVILQPEVILKPDVVTQTDTTTKLDETALQRIIKPEPSSELQCATKPEPSTEPQHTTKPEPSTEPQHTTKPETSTKPQHTTKPEASTEPQRATKPEPSTEPQHATKPEQSTELQRATKPDPSSAPQPGITLESAPAPKRSPQTSKNTSEKESKTAVTLTKTQEDSCKIRKTPGDLPSPKSTKQTKAEVASVKDKEIKDTGPELKVSTLTWPKKRPSITSQTSLPEGKPSIKQDIQSNMDDKFSSKFPLKPSGSFANNGNLFNSRIQQGNTEITISKKSLNPSPQPKIAGIVLGQTHPRESDSSIQKKDLFKQRSESTETKPKVITHKIIVEGKDVTENPVSEKSKGPSNVSQPINIENQQPLTHPLLKTLQSDRFERRCSDISCFMHEMESSTDGASIINEIKKLSSRLFESDLLDSSNNNSTSNLLRQIANRGVVPRRPKFRITNLNRDVPIGSPPPPTNMTYFMPPNLLSPDSYSSQTHSAPQSPRGSPERMPQTLDKDVILRLFNKLEEHSDSTVTKNYVINDSQKKFSSVSSK